MQTEWRVGRITNYIETDYPGALWRFLDTCGMDMAVVWIPYALDGAATEALASQHEIAIGVQRLSNGVIEVQSIVSRIG